MSNSQEKCSLQDILDFGNNDDDFYRKSLDSNIQNLHQICRQVTEMIRHQTKQTENRTYLTHDEIECVTDFHKESSEYLIQVAKALNEWKSLDESVAGVKNAGNLKTEIIRLLNTVKAELKTTDDLFKALERIEFDD